MRSFLILLLLYASMNASAQCSCDSLKALAQKNLTRKYLHKHVSTLLQDSLFQYPHKMFFSEEPPFKLHHLSLNFDKCMEVQVYVKHKHVPRFNINGNWDMEKFKKERIREIYIERVGGSIRDIVIKRISK